MAPEKASATNRIDALTGTGPLQRDPPFALVALDRTTSAEIGRVPVVGVVGPPRRLLRWGARGVAFLEASTSFEPTCTHLVVVTSSLIADPP